MDLSTAQLDQAMAGVRALDGTETRELRGTELHAAIVTACEVLSAARRLAAPVAAAVARDAGGTGVRGGITAPISAATARHMAVEAEILPIVCNGESKVLDHGRAQRLVSRAQRRALSLRDGGCTDLCNGTTRQNPHLLSARQAMGRGRPTFAGLLCRCVVLGSTRTGATNVLIRVACE